MPPVRRTLLLVVALSLLSGCDTTPEQRLGLAQAWLATGQGWSRSLDDAIAAGELILEDITARLSDPNLPPKEAAQLKAVAAEAAKQVDAFREKKAAIDADVAVLRARLEKVKEGGGTIADEMEFYSHGLQVLGQRVGGSAGGYITLGALLLGSIGAAARGYLQSQKSREVLGNVVSSVSALLSSPTVTNRDTATELLQAGQLPGTVTEVRKLLGKNV
jgi:hypothetical protein